jgi:hypothetical protein
MVGESNESASSTGANGDLSASDLNVANAGVA